LVPALHDLLCKTALIPFPEQGYQGKNSRNGTVLQSAGRVLRPGGDPVRTGKAVNRVPGGELRAISRVR
jgi:hypothetical protein